jgi:thiol-disulfide isomerase/thioredoxin
VLAVCGFSANCSRHKPDNENGPAPGLSGPPHSALPMPLLKVDSELGWVLSDGSRSKLSDYRRKVLVLDFYATWCEPCRRSIPHLITLQKQYQRQDLEVVGLNVGGPDDRIKVAGFARELNISYPLGFPDQALTDLLLSDNQTIPQSFVFSRNGQLVKRFIGYDASTGVELEKALQAELAETVEH